MHGWHWWYIWFCHHHHIIPPWHIVHIIWHH